MTMGKGGGRNVTAADKADVTKLATEVKKGMKDGEKKPPEIAKAIKRCRTGRYITCQACGAR